MLNVNSTDSLNSATSPTTPIQNWSNRDVKVIIVNTGEVCVVKDNQEWENIIQGSGDRKCLIVLESGRISVKKIGQSETNYVIRRGAFVIREKSSKEYEEQMKGFEYFNEYMEYSIEKFERSRDRLRMRLETLQKMNFTEKFKDFEVDSSLEFDFSRMLGEMQKKLQPTIDLLQKIINGMNDFLINRIKKSILDLSSKEDKVEYFKQLVNDFEQVFKQIKHPYEDITERLYRELLIFDKFDEHYNRTLTEFSRRNSLNRIIDEKNKKLKEEEKERQEKFLKGIGEENLVFVVKAIPTITDYEMVDTQSSVHLINSGNMNKMLSTSQSEDDLLESEDVEVVNSNRLKDEKIQSMESEVETLKNQINELKQQLERKEEENNSLVNRIDTISIEKNNLFENCKIETQKTIDLEQRIKDLQKEFKNETELIKKENEENNRQLIEEKTQLLILFEIEKNENMTSLEKIQDYERQIKSMTEEFKQEKESWSREKIEILKLNQENTNIMELLKQEKEQTCTLFKKICLLNEENEARESKYKINIDEQIEKYEIMVSKVDETNKQLVTNQEECNSLKKELENALSKISHLDDVIKGLHEDIANNGKYQQQQIDSIDSLTLNLSEKITELEKLETIKKNLEHILDENIQEKDKLKYEMEILSEQCETKLYIISEENANLNELVKKLESEKNELLLNMSTIVDQPMTSQSEKQHELLKSLATQLQIICFLLTSVLQDRTGWIENTLNTITMLIDGDVNNLNETHLEDIVRGLCNRWWFARDKKLLNDAGTDVRGANP